MTVRLLHIIHSNSIATLKVVQWIFVKCFATCKFSLIFFKFCDKSQLTCLKNLRFTKARSANPVIYLRMCCLLPYFLAPLNGQACFDCAHNQWPVLRKASSLAPFCQSDFDGTHNYTNNCSRDGWLSQARKYNTVAFVIDRVWQGLLKFQDSRLKSGPYFIALQIHCYAYSYAVWFCIFGSRECSQQKYDKHSAKELTGCLWVS